MQRFIDRQHFNPTDKLEEAFKTAWPEDHKIVRWKLILLAGRV